MVPTHGEKIATLESRTEHLHESVAYMRKRELIIIGIFSTAVIAALAGHAFVNSLLVSTSAANIRTDIAVVGASIGTLTAKVDANREDIAQIKQFFVPVIRKDIMDDTGRDVGLISGEAVAQEWASIEESGSTTSAYNFGFKIAGQRAHEGFEQILTRLEQVTLNNAHGESQRAVINTLNTARIYLRAHRMPAENYDSDQSTPDDIKPTRGG